MRYVWKMLALLFFLAVLAQVSENLAVGAIIVVLFFALAGYVARQLERGSDA